MYLDDRLETIFGLFIIAMMCLWQIAYGLNSENQTNLSTLSGQVIKTKMVDASSSDVEYKVTVKSESGKSKNFKLDPTLNSYVKKGDTVKIVKNADDEVQSIQKINE